MWRSHYQDHDSVGNQASCQKSQSIVSSGEMREKTNITTGHICRTRSQGESKFYIKVVVSNSTVRRGSSHCNVNKKHSEEICFEGILIPKQVPVLNTNAPAVKAMATAFFLHIPFQELHSWEDNLLVYFIYQSITF